MHLDSPSDPPKPPRKLKERDPLHNSQRDPAPTDLAERMIAIQRRNAVLSRPRERADRVPSSSLTRSPEKSPNPTPSSSATRVPPTSPRRQHPHSHVILPRTEADPDDFSRRLKISTSPSPRTSPQSKAQAVKLFNHETDSIQMRNTLEPESISDTASNSFVPRGPPNGAVRDVHSRQLFDHRKHDPVRFAVLARPHGRPTPTPKSSADYVSASSTSSYANSVTSSNFTLSSNTDDSSASSALFERQGRPSEDPGNNVFAVQLKKLYRTISALEDKVKQQDADEMIEDSRITLKGKQVENNDDLEKEKWKKQIVNHKRLAELIHNLLEISLAPSVPASLRNIPTKYNIIIRLWTYAFHKPLESLRRASFTSLLAFEHLQDFIYYAYTFYTGLLEEPTLSTFKGGWLEALGDLARYRMAVAAMVTGTMGSGPALTADAVCLAAAAAAAADGTSKPTSGSDSKSVSDSPADRVNESPSPSVGVAAARLLDVEPEKERWRGVARDWYGAGLADTPGTGKLHHHLGLLSREVEGEELRGIYHFIKSMTTLHPFTTSRESILPLWSASAQAKRMLPDARAPDLFVLLHGMLFTNIQLDDFQPTLARFVERLEIEGAEEREWVMMAVINISAVLEYGKPGGVLKKRGGVGGRESTTVPTGMRMVAKRGALDDENMDVDEQRGEQEPKLAPTITAIQTSPALALAEAAAEPPAPFKLALQLTFAMLTHVLRCPTRQASPIAHSVLNPYLTVLLTFLATVLRHTATLEVIERSVPWEELAQFFARVPRNVMASQGLGLGQAQAPGERWTMLTSSCAPPLPEDWCMRGMEWVGRRVYERGFWKVAEERRPELEVLDKSEAGEVTDGIIEDGDEDEDSGKKGVLGENIRRWVRVLRCAVGLASAVNGFTWIEGTRGWKVEGELEGKVKQWRMEDRIEREEEERRRMGRRWSDDSMDVDQEDCVGDDTSESEDDEEDSEDVKALKARRRYLRSLLQSAQRDTMASSPPSRRARPRRPRKEALTRPSLSIVAGYTILVVDTNILLSSLSMFASVVESLRWTVVVPLPVIMELDGLAINASQLGEAAQGALAYVTSHVRSHSASLKVQTSKGNYLTTLSVRVEQVDFDDGKSRERNMDDLILKAAIWQDEHWIDRSAMFKDDGATKDTTQAVKVVLLSLDRNLRLKARSRQLPAASERDLASILATGT